MKLRTQLMILFVGCGLVPAGVAGIVGQMSTRSGMQTVAAEGAAGADRLARDTLIAQCAIKKSQIEAYFNGIRDQVLTFSENGMVVDAMRDLRTTFSEYRTEAGIDAEDLSRQRRELFTYYTNKFGPEYRSQNGRDADLDAYFSDVDEDAVALQYAYIQANTNPLGSKHDLDAADDGTA